MRCSLHVLAMSPLVLLFSACRATDLVSDSSSLTVMSAVRVEVREIETNQPVYGVRLFVRKDSLPPASYESPAAFDDELTGILQLDNLAPGTYWITARRAGAVDVHQRVQVSAGSVFVIHMHAPAPVCGLGPVTVPATLLA
jgi:hypothetical protein